MPSFLDGFFAFNLFLQCGHSMKTVQLYTDGSCLGNPGPGGWAALLKFGKHEKLISGNEPESTNNRMEIMAVIQGLRALSEECIVQIYTDSQYVMNAFEQHWLEGWQKNNWRTSQKKPVKNQDLWQEMVEVTKKHQLKWTWVKGHAGHPENERVDVAAREAAMKI